MKVLESKEVYPGWYHVEWLYPGFHRVAAVRQLRLAEQEMKSSGGFGWLMESDKSHVQMHPIIEKLGGKKYNEDSDHFFYMKRFKLEA